MLDAPRELLDSEEAGLVSLYATDAGAATAEAPPVLLLHAPSLAASAYEMRPLLERLRGTRRVFVPDLPGFGRSGHAVQRYLPDMYAAAIADVLDRIGQPADVVAHALSCEFATMAALEHPERVRSLAFLSPTGLNQRENAIQRLNREGISPRMHHALSNPLWREVLYRALTTKAALRMLVGRHVHGRLDRDLLSATHEAARAPGARLAGFFYMSGAMFTPDILRRHYVKLQHPVLVLHDRSPDFTFDALPELERRRANWRSVRVAPSRGLVHWDQPDATLLALEAFWSGLVTSHAEL